MAVEIEWVKRPVILVVWQKCRGCQWWALFAGVGDGFGRVVSIDFSGV
jgi:hypothetical protein